MQFEGKTAVLTGQNYTIDGGRTAQLSLA